MKMVAVLAAALATSAQAATFYFDSAGGSDANDGLTPATAWQTLDKANAVPAKPGDRVLFKRGGVWRGTLKSKSGEDAAKISIPLADGNPDSRVYAYEVVVVGDEGTPKLRKAVYAAGVNMGIGHEPNGGVTTLEIPKSELPPGKTLTVAVRPLTSLGTSGKAIMTTFKV